MAKQRLNPMQRAFARQMARTGDHEYSATKAGYAHPQIAGWKLMKNEIVADFTREIAARHLREIGGPIGYQTVLEVARDKAQPGGTRVKAGTELMKAAGMYAGDEESTKEPHEMTVDELAQLISKQQRQLEALQRARADAARPIIDHDPGPFG